MHPSKKRAIQKWIRGFESLTFSEAPNDYSFGAFSDVIEVNSAVENLHDLMQLILGYLAFPHTEWVD